MIEGVAIKHGDLMVCLPKPNRHHHCIHHMVTVLKQKPPVSNRFEEQGFYTDSGFYLNRMEAFKYAVKNGIPFVREEPHFMTWQGNEIQYLLSEDLW